MLNKNILKYKKMGSDDDIGPVDTLQVLKRKTVKLSDANKEKIKILDQYTKNLSIIKDCFQQIMNNTGIVNIQEIMNIFIKSEEQNYQL